jgi:hypothetical protein
MLSYRHAFHAGNHADVLKHLILVQIARYMGEKPAPFWIIDTHAGAGRYALESEHARKLGEWREGIGRLWETDGLPPAAVDYVEQVKMLNPDGQLRHYPGSPWLARQLLRDGDRLRLSVGTATASGAVTSTVDVDLGDVEPTFTVSAVRATDGGWRWTSRLTLVADAGTYTGSINGTPAQVRVVSPLTWTLDVDSWRTSSREGPAVAVLTR